MSSFLLLEQKNKLALISFASYHIDHMNLLLPAIFAFTTMRMQHDSTCLTAIVKACQLKKTWHSTKLSHSCFQKQCFRRNMCQREHPGLSLEFLVDKLSKAHSGVSFISDIPIDKLSSWTGQKKDKTVNKICFSSL